MRTTARPKRRRSRSTGRPKPHYIGRRTRRGCLSAVRLHRSWDPDPGLGGGLRQPSSSLALDVALRHRLQPCVEPRPTSHAQARASGVGPPPALASQGARKHDPKGRSRAVLPRAHHGDRKSAELCPERVKRHSPSVPRCKPCPSYAGVAGVTRVTMPSARDAAHAEPIVDGFGAGRPRNPDDEGTVLIQAARPLHRGAGLSPHREPVSAVQRDGVV
jgi:hypothetical protein